MSHSDTDDGEGGLGAGRRVDLVKRKMHMGSGGDGVGRGWPPTRWCPRPTERGVGVPVGERPRRRVSRDDPPSGTEPRATFCVRCETFGCT